MEPQVTARGGLLTMEMAVRSAEKRTDASKGPQPNPVPPLGSATSRKSESSALAYLLPRPLHPTVSSRVLRSRVEKAAGDPFSSSGALRDRRLVPLKEETLVESSGKGGKVERSLSPSRSPDYKLQPLIGAKVSSCQPDFPLQTNVVRLQQ